jgi:hypothetical protein
MSLSDAYLDEQGNEHYDTCYHGSHYKGNHSECFWTVLPNCTGCGKEILENASRIGIRYPNFKRTEWLHPGCAQLVAARYQRIATRLAGNTELLKELEK